MTSRPAASTPRLLSVDLLRGVIMVVMALDHVRDFVHYQVNPTNLATTTGPLFATRWITHLCAPVFMLLAGASAHLQLTRGKSKVELSRFLVSRGLWLVVLEVTVIRCLGWWWNFDYRITGLIVIWALGIAMIVLAGLIWLPRRVVLALSIVAIGGHNLLDGYVPDGPLGWLWHLVHVPGPVLESSHAIVRVGYPLLPWVFVMALGYAAGPMLAWPPLRRQRTLVIAGLAMIAAFIVLRAVLGQGDPRPWTTGSGVLAFLHVQKYPPSLCYLLATLGPALLMLAAFERWEGRIANVVLVFGRVPMFYYLLHLPLIHGVAVLLALTRYDSVGFLLTNPVSSPMPPGYGYSLAITYLVWAGVIAALYVPCRWFAAYKQTHRQWWLTYL